MRTLVPNPVLSALLFVAWPVLVTSVEPGHLVLAAVLAIAIPLALRSVLGPGLGIARPLLAVRLVLVVMWDVVVANIAVARLVLGSMARPQPGFVVVPLDCTHPYAIALFASCMTMTPGTVSAHVDTENRRIIVHVLDLADAAKLVAEVKARYEKPLMEIFGC